MDAWWIENPRVLGSDNPTTDDLDYLRRTGFDVLISLLQEDVQVPRYDIERAESSGFVRYNIPVKDFHPPTLDQLLEFMQILNRHPEHARMIIHCQAGMGRTGTFAAAYWIAKGMSVTEAIAFVRKNRMYAIETTQEAVLEEFATHIGELGNG